MDFSVIMSSAAPLARGAATTMVVSGLSIVLGGVLAMAFVFTRQGATTVSLMWRAFIAAFVSLFRGTPLLAQLIVIFYVLPVFVGIEIAPLPAAVLTLSLNTAAFQSEIYRASLKSIAQGQIEAAQMVGLSVWRTRLRILLPQMLRLSWEPITNEIITILKNSSLISIISVIELTRVGQQIAGATFRPSEAYIAIAILYFLMTSLIVAAGHLLRRRVAGAI